MFRIELDGWMANIRFSASHFIPGHEKCSRLHGHDYAVHLKVFGGLNDQGMLVDFVALKATLRKLVEPLDHRVLIPGKSDGILVERSKDSLKVRVKGGGSYVLPADETVVLDIRAASAEELANYFLDRLVEVGGFPGNVEKVEVGVDEGRGQGARAERVLKR